MEAERAPEQGLVGSTQGRDAGGAGVGGDERRLHQHRLHQRLHLHCHLHSAQFEALDCIHELTRVVVGMLVSGDDRGNIWLYILDEIARNPTKLDSSLKPSRVGRNAFNAF